MYAATAYQNKNADWLASHDAQKWRLCGEDALGVMAQMVIAPRLLVPFRRSGFRNAVQATAHE